jgi:all-trans-8'-apo-beta-carotenal 15,15'-oxygenase
MTTIRGPTAEEIENLLPQVSRGWSNVERECPEGFYFEQSQIEGEIPLGLKGTFVRNGPGFNVVYGTQLVHPIDGDGLVAALTFLEGKAHFRARFVNTKSHEDETKAKRMLYDGQMGTKAPAEGKKKGWRDPSHTNVFYHGGKLFAAHEYALPHSLDPVTLETLGADSLNDTLELRTMSAHYRYDADADIIVTCSFKAGNPLAQKLPRISFYEWDRKMSLKTASRLEIPEVNYAHDFLLTPSFYLVHVSPFIDLSKSTLKAIAAGKTSPGQSMKYVPGAPSEFVLIERKPASEQSRKVIYFYTEPCHIYHFAHCRESPETGIISFQACCLPVGFNMNWQYKAFLSNTGDAPGTMFSFELHPETGSILRKPTPGLETTSCEFPTTHPFRHCPRSLKVSTRYMYLMAGQPSVAMPFTDVVKYDLQSGLVSRWHSEGVIGEPCFMPRLGRASAWHGDEDDGWIIVQLYRYKEHRVQFCILDARKLHNGPICRLNLPFHLPYGFHGTFVDDVFVVPKPKL